MKEIMKNIECVNQGISLFTHDDAMYHTVYQQYGNNPKLVELVRIDSELHKIEMFYELLYPTDINYNPHQHDMVYVKYSILLGDCIISVKEKKDIKTYYPVIIFGSLLGKDYMYIYDKNSDRYSTEPNIETRVDITNKPVKMQYKQVNNKLHINIIV